MRPAPTTSTYRPEIDGLRAFAVLAVIGHHFSDRGLPSGYLGVDIFLVISGFVITASLAGRSAASAGRFLADFYARRLKRLLPALLVCVAVTSLLICLFNPAPIVSLETAQQALWGQSNHYLLRRTVDYFTISAKLNAFTHTWSLSVETQFYLVFPLLLWLTGFAQHQPGSERRLGRLMLLLAAVSLAAFVYCSITNRQAWSYFLMPLRFWELAAGCLLFLTRRSCPAWLRPEFCLGGIGLLLFMPLTWIAPTTIAGVGLTLLLLFSLRSGTPTYHWLTRPWMTGLGRISYSLYLWHWAVLVISRWTIGIHWWSVPLQLGLMLGLAILSYRYVEAPCRHAPWLKAIGVTIALSLFSTWGLGQALSQLHQHYPKLYAGKPLMPLATPAPVTVAPCYLNPSPNFLDIGNHAAMPPVCGQRSDSETATVYQFGDSHMDQFHGPITAWARSQNLATMSVFGEFCQFPAVRRQRLLPGHTTEQLDPCYASQEKLEANLLGRVKRGDYVFIGNALYGAFSGHWVDWVEDWYVDAEGRSISQPQALADYLQRLEQLARKLSDRGVTVVLFLDSAHFLEMTQVNDATLCRKQWFNILPEGCQIPTQQFLAQRRPIAQGLQKIAQRDRVYLWDGLDRHTCDDRVCTAARYVDNNHFTADYAEYLFQTFRQQHPQIFDRRERGLPLPVK
jgi:peptidoglycan/LPS O-acetylase OafA/YrhL